jgi:hypothetical protein
MNQFAVIAAPQLPSLITASGDRAGWRFMQFFTAAIRNPNTRRAYARDVRGFTAGSGRSNDSGNECCPCGARRRSSWKFPPT